MKTLNFSLLVAFDIFCCEYWLSQGMTKMRRQEYQNKPKKKEKTKTSGGKQDGQDTIYCCFKNKEI